MCAVAEVGAVVVVVVIAVAVGGVVEAVVVAVGDKVLTPDSLSPLVSLHASVSILKGH